MIQSKLMFFLVFLTLLLQNVTADRTKDRIYDDIKGAAACFRRMNATHQTGCSSDREGSTGIVYLIEELTDLKTLLNHGSGQSYIPLMPIDVLNEEGGALLKNSPKISGLLLFKDNQTIIQHYSHEDKCPNRNFNQEKTCEVNWNRYGTNILNENFNFPIFLVTNNTELGNLKKCFFKFNNVSIETHHARALCSVELSSFMFAAINTPTCLRRSSPFFNLNTVKLCDPLGSSNVWASLYPLGNTSDIKYPDGVKNIIVTARLDTTSLFADQEKGAINPISSFVTLMYIGGELKKMLADFKDYKKNVIFLLLSGESYDYIGSQRFVYDLNAGLFPSGDFSNENETIKNLTPDDIDFVLELNQLGNIKNEFYVHLNQKIDFLKKLQKYKANLNVKESFGNLPPSSLQSFLKSNITGIVISDHNESYSNHFYNSILDDSNNLKYEYYENFEEIPKESIQYYTARLGRVVVNSLYEEITGNPASESSLNVELTNELFNCYLKNATCKIHNAVAKKRLRDTQLNLYVGVTVSRSILVAYAGLTLSWLTGDIYDDSGPCPGKMNSYLFKYYNMSKSWDELNTTICYRSCMNLTEAVSPAFIIKDYDWSSNEYSSWTESVWRELSVRMFLRPSPSHEKMTFAIGAMVMALSFIFVYFVSSRSHVLFSGVETSTPTRC
nr:nicastrin [Onthophagus taurus]